MTSRSSVLSVAAVVYDQDTHSESDIAFLEAIGAANDEWHAQMRAANLNFGGGSESWEAVKRLATRSRDEAYARALARLEAHDEIEPELQTAAE